MHLTACAWICTYVRIRHTDTQNHRMPHILSLSLLPPTFSLFYFSSLTPTFISLYLSISVTVCLLISVSVSQSLSPYFHLHSYLLSSFSHVSLSLSPSTFKPYPSPPTDAHFSAGRTATTACSVPPCSWLSSHLRPITPRPLCENRTRRKSIDMR